ncbi:hypothetical protein AMTRI_Chr09g36010 [Amborella trichopoda]
MVAGSLSSSASMKQERRHPLREQMVPRRPSSRQQYSGRFIPDRRTMDLDVARYMLMDSKKENTTSGSPSKEAYRKHLSVIVLKNRTRILAFKSKPPTLERAYEEVLSDKYQVRSTKPRRHSSKLLDDYYLNLLDWSCGNVLAIALGNTVYQWDGSCLCQNICASMHWFFLYVCVFGFSASLFIIVLALEQPTGWSTYELITVGEFPLVWNSHILTTGGHDGLIINNDVRGHQQEVCGLKWSNSCKQLASGGDDNILHIWDQSLSNSSNSPLHRLEDHLAACPFQRNLLASGGGGADRCIKFWNTHTRACINSVDTGSQVCSLLWSKNERELLSSDGFTQNQLTVWKYPSMVKLAGHTYRVLFMAQSLDGCTVVSAGAD